MISPVSNLSYRKQLLEIFAAAVAAVGGERVVRDWLQAHWALSESSAVVAIGKAASAMMAGAEQALQQDLSEALLITKTGHVQAYGHGAQVHVVESAHPVPDQRSLDAGRELLSFLSRLPESRRLLVLVSGGASSLVEVLRPGHSLEELAMLNQQLLASGKDIHEINRERRNLSALKGCGLNQFVQGRAVQALVISDVSGDDPRVIGSGMLCAGGQIDVAVIATLHDAINAAQQQAEVFGYPVFLDAQPMRGDAARTGQAFARMLKSARPGVYIRGGETTVTLPEQPGAGGRNQHLALAAAIELPGCANCVVLAAGTDGSDGPTGDAGALIDGGTIQRAALAGIDDPGEYLRRADSASLLAASGDLVNTGPTGTNVTDLLIGLKWSDE